ncbi:MAG: PilW family protein [Betaproteobacteria bacterium]|nr:PilW family protein [Betaproteobacteria bacterium]
MKTQTVLRRAAGMSLVELMVGAAIGLIGIVIITHIYLTNEQHKRSTTAAGGAQTNGAIALFALERDIRQAGFGLNSSFAFECNCDSLTNAGCSAIQYYYDLKYTFPPNASMMNSRNGLTLYPLIITNLDTAAGPNTGPDTISVFYGSDNERALSTRLIAPLNPMTADIKPDGVAGIEPNDLVVLQEGTKCAMFQVTGVASESLVHAPNLWNPPGGLPTFAQDQTRVFNLGARPVWKTFGIQYTQPLRDVNLGKLQVTDQLRFLTEPGYVTQDLMDGIVDLQAQYGKDIDGDGDVDVWTKELPAGGPLTNFNATDIMQVIAVRLAVLARSDHFEKPSTPGGPCEATTAANRPTWSGGDFLTFNAPGALPSCHKYRVFETVVPLRNMMWRPE